MRIFTVAGHLLVTLCATILIVVCWHEVAYAYIDPSSGSYFLQLLLASLLGAAFAIKVFWRRIKLFFSRLFGRNEGSEPLD